MKSLGRRARGINRHKQHKQHKPHKQCIRRSRSRLPNDSSCAPIGPDEMRKEKKKRSRLAESPTVGARTSAVGGTKPPESVYPSEPGNGRNFPRSRCPQSKSKCARDEAWRPQDEGCRRGEFSPTERPSSSLARSSPVRARKTGSKTARAGLGTSPKTRDASDGKRKRRFEKTNRTIRKNLRTRGLASRRAYALGEHARPWGSIPRGRRTPSGSRRCGRPT